MGTLLASVYALHLLFGGLWTGSVLFFTYSVYPLARDGDLSPAVLGSAADKLTTVSRAGAVLQLLTGGYMASPMGVGTSGYWSTTSGMLVAAMVVLWLLLAGLTEMAAKRLSDGADVDKVRSPAADTKNYLYAASVVAVLLLLDAGALAGGL